MTNQPGLNGQPSIMIILLWSQMFPSILRLLKKPTNAGICTAVNFTCGAPVFTSQIFGLVFQVSVETTEDFYYLNHCWVGVQMCSVTRLGTATAAVAHMMWLKTALLSSLQTEYWFHLMHTYDAVKNCFSFQSLDTKSPDFTWRTHTRCG